VAAGSSAVGSAYNDAQDRCREVSVTVDGSLTRAQHAQVRAHLQALRTSLVQARDALMHFKDDRLDRDKLEPAARRADDLMNMFAGDTRDLTQGAVWVAEIKSGVEQVTNPKAAAALRDAQVDITTLLDMMSATKIKP
jgi:hypothetical protein